MLFPASVIALYSGTLAWATPVLWEGRAPRTYGKTDINESLGPYFRYAVVRSIIPPNDLILGSKRRERDTECQSRKCTSCLAAARRASAEYFPLAVLPVSRPHPRRDTDMAHT